MLNIVGKLLRGQDKLAISSKADRLKTIRFNVGVWLVRRNFACQICLNLFICSIFFYERIILGAYKYGWLL